MSGNTKLPYVLAIAIEVMYTSTYVATEAAFDLGMNAFVFTFYRQAAASLLLVPIARLPKEKIAIFIAQVALEAVFLCLNRNTCCLNLINMSMALTSANVATAAANSIPVFTFLFALLFRMEVLKLRSCSGVAKLAGIGLCISGVFVMAFYAGPALSPVNHHHAFTHTLSPKNSPSRVTWIIGTFLMVLATVLWSIWLVMQTGLLKEYPNKMLVTVTQCMFSVAQCFLVAVVAERDFSKWSLRPDLSLLAIIYTGFVGTGVCYYLQVWCMQMRGPVFMAIWTPLLFIFTMFCSSFFLGEIVDVGSIIGGVLLVGGLYSVLWGKTKEPRITQCSDHGEHANTTDGIQDEEDGHRIPHQEVETNNASDLTVEQV